MRELLGYVPPMEEVKKSLAGAFAETLDIEFEAEGFYPEEVQSLNRETPLFGSEAWIYRRQFSA